MARWCIDCGANIPKSDRDIFTKCRNCRTIDTKATKSFASINSEVLN